MKRSKVEAQSSPSLPVPGMVDLGRLRHPPVTKSWSPPVNVYPSRNNLVVGQSKTARYGDQDEEQTFSDYFDGDELSATVLCCDYPECQSMGALQKDYLRDHYLTYHEESLIKPPVLIPSATSITHSRSLRCSACLAKLTDKNQGRTCDNCQRFESMQDAAMNAELIYMNGMEGTALILNISIHILHKADSIDASTHPPGPYLEAVEASEGEHLGSSLKQHTEENAPPKPSFWTPPEIPEHW
jgi:hypothetical protein